jgi:zinc transporter 7
LAIFVGVLAWNVAAAAVKGETGMPVGTLTPHEIEEQLQVCYASTMLVSFYHN